MQGELRWIGAWRIYSSNFTFAITGDNVSRSLVKKYLTHLIYCADTDADLQGEPVLCVYNDLNYKHFTISASL